MESEVKGGGKYELKKKISSPPSPPYPHTLSPPIQNEIKIEKGHRYFLNILFSLAEYLFPKAPTSQCTE